MSLVEKALGKMQQSAAAAAAKAAAQRTADPSVSARGAERPPVAAPAQNGPRLTIDSAALRSAGLLPPEQDERQLAQQYRQIKRPLIANAIGRGTPRLANGCLIMVASAVPGEGKTFTSINLALSLSIEKDVHVLLIDADVAKPHISEVLGATENPGLLDALRDRSLNVEQMILGTDVHNLSFLPAGKPSAEATELLASARMEQLADELTQRDRQRIVVVDSPPLLYTTESRALIQMAGQVVVVVRAESTAQPVVLDALKLLEGHPSVSLVLNQSLYTNTSDYYYYGHGGTGAAGS
jgi:protein-tyrosine kinase